MTNILKIVDLILRLAGLIARAREAGRDVTDEEVNAVFDRADRGDAAWKAGLPKTAPNEGESDARPG